MIGADPHPPSSKHGLIANLVNTQFRFYVQPVRHGSGHRFQVRIGFEGLRLSDYVPAYRSAFAQLLQIEASHADEAEAREEAKMLEEFLETRE